MRLRTFCVLVAACSLAFAGSRLLPMTRCVPSSGGPSYSVPTAVAPAVRRYDPGVLTYDEDAEVYFN
jgi:hypothetical protein